MHFVRLEVQKKNHLNRKKILNHRKNKGLGRDDFGGAFFGE
ncbi:hypothetical protein GGR96_003182 [Thalassospira tepidiphila]|uniref:Uncharacterized protein n=1 Tax=Thalassospira tepidiphila TaxID=393657 RepID=A0ABX0X347_9PROT|nr:hypothetical protein [Thalassospira tepidiphila]